MSLKILKKTIVVFLDVLFVCAAWLLSMLLFKQDINRFIVSSWYLLLIAVVIAIGSNAIFGFYTKILRFLSLGDALLIILAGLVQLVYFALLSIFHSLVQIEVTIVYTLIYLVFLGGSKFLYKCYAYLIARHKHYTERQDGIKVIVIGAGEAGSMVIREMTLSDKINYVPVCVMDDDLSKKGQVISGVKVFGAIDEIGEAVKTYEPDEIVIAIPSLSKKDLRRIVMLCKETGCKVKNIPGSYQFVNGQASVSDVKEVNITDILGRDQIKINLDEIAGYITDKVVLVTGGGGSIGSELCRQIAQRSPKQLIILDVYENNAYEIEQELKRKYKDDLNLLTLIASVRDSKKINKVFEQYRPQIVFHAAAHKHVPLMETSPNEAVKNNVSGTYKVADAAGRYGTERFVLISTDKAVNPTNIMGATKRICEMIIQTMDKKYKTEYVAVRFGNVLGSNGSVIPLFTKQIASGGPVTVTHPDIVRYFMTIPEAVSLVLQAGAYAKGGEIFVLDMGEPVRIYDLAVNMIKLSGLEPNKDIDVVVTGLRPGEKLYEERLMAEEGLERTSNDMISIGKPLVFDEENLFRKINELYVEAYNETDRMKQLVKELVPTYKIDGKD